MRCFVFCVFFCVHMQTKPLIDIPAQSYIFSAMPQLFWRGASTITLHTQVIWFHLYDYGYVTYLEDPYWNNLLSGFILSSKHEWLLCEQAWWERQEKLRQMYTGRYPALRSHMLYSLSESFGVFNIPCCDSSLIFLAPFLIKETLYQIWLNPGDKEVSNHMKLKYFCCNWQSFHLAKALNIFCFLLHRLLQTFI